MSIAPANVQSSRDILSWQYKTLIGELQQVELHVSSGDCPCILKDLDPAEYCLAKHTLNIATLAAETANMDSANSKLLARLNDSAIEKHDGVKLFVCHKGDLPELAEWARLYRKKLEPIYYVCSRKAHMKQEVVTVTCPPIWKTAEMSQEAVVCQRQAVDPRQLTIDKWLEEASKAAPAPAGNPAIAQKLRAAADALDAQIEGQLHPAISDQRPTGRRARIAEGMYREGVRLQEIQRTLRGLADAHDAGTILPMLAGIRTKAQVEEIVTHKSFPRLGLHIERVKDILKPTQGLPGTREKWQILELAMRRSGSDYWIPLTEEEMAVTEDLLKISEQHGNKDPWTKLEFGHYKRLTAIGIRDDETFQAVKKAIADLVAGKPIEVPKDIQQRRLEAKLIGLKIPGFFTTPRELADRMVRMAGLRVGMKVLEPSAGSGNIADAIKAACPECPLTLVEYHQTLLEILKAKGYDPVPGDFLQFQSGGYDRIVMNPPFEHGQDVDHVRHAFELLKDGGRLVAIMGEHAFFGGDQKSMAFRAWLDELGGSSEQLPSGTFEHQATSTGVASRVVVIDKPEDLAVSSDREVVEWVKSRQGRGYPAQDLVSLVQYPDQPERALLVQSIVKYLDKNKATYDEYRIRVHDIPELQPFIDEYEVAGAILRGQPVPRSILKSAWVPKMGDKVEYQGEVWEVGFVNNRTTGWAGTLRLQKSGDAGARSVNRVDPREVKPVEAAIAQTAKMSIDYNASGCEAGIGRYVDAIAGLERLRDKVREQHEYAPGRLRDLFDAMPGAITRALIIDEGPLVEALQSSRQHALKIIDQARDEMMRRKTKNVAVYLPSYRPGLEKVVADLQRLLFQEVMGAASECLCTKGPVQQRFSGLQGRRGIQRQGAGAMEQVAVCKQEVVTCSANGATCAVMPETAGPSAAGEKVYELFPFQEEGVAWLKGRSFALLADDMGLGKTPQGIHWGADFRPVLVVVPSALTLNWQREITQMWRKADAAILLDGTNELPAPLPDWTIISYGRLDRYLPQLRRAGFRAIIIDEAHSVKNLESQRTQFLLELVDPHQPHDTDTPIPNRLAITGTPILNKPIEIFPLLVFLGLKKREDLTDFVKEYSQWHLHGGKISYSGVRNLDKLNQYLKTFMLRRLKKDVLTTLPPKLHTSLFVPISNAMEYAQAERDFVSWLNEHLGDAAPQDMTMKMNVLRQIASNGKVQPVCDWLKPCVQGGGKVILFSSFIEPLEKLSDCQPASVLYTGSNTSPERQAMVDDFQKNPETCFFMGSVGAAGVGITLTAANRVAFLDLPWTPGAKAQAEDRAHRIGQTRPVEIVHVLAKGTIDERMLEILSEKEKIIAQAIDGQGKSEAEASSIAESLIQHYRSTPAIAGLHQYETEERDTPVDSLTEDDLRILQGDMRQEGKMCQVSTISKADAIRKAHELSQKRIDSFDPEAAVTKIGKRWTYTGYSGTQHPSLFDTRKEAVEAATGHKKLKQDEFDNPEGYWPGVSTPVTISGVCEKGKPCSIKVKASDVEEKTTTIGLLPEAINDVVRKLERHRAAPISDLTFAIGPTTLTRYEFRNRLVEAEALKASHNPITFEPTPGYPADLQPRLRARSANKTQVQTIAANLDPDSLLSDFHSIDRGAPIVGPDLAVESGNGRVMALQLAIVQHPDVYAKYRAEVIARAEGLGLSPEQAQSMTHPVVVRERVTDVPRRQFVEEANASTTLAPSAIEVARSDALKVTPEMLNTLVVGEEQSIEDALRSPANRAFVTAFLGKLSPNEIAQISDKYGAMNQDGIRRLTLAVFVAAFPGEAGLSLAEKFFESTEPTIRNIANGIAQALGKLAKVEAKDASLAIGVDIAAAARVFADIKKTPGMTVPNYLSQGQMFEKQLKPFQEVLLTLLDERSRSGKRVGALLRAYCDVVLEAPPPQQIGLMPDISRLTKEEALKTAVRRAEEQIEGPRLFQAAACPQHPAWCSALTKARTELDKVVKSLSASKTAVQKYRGQLDRPLQVCQGQTPMFQGEQKMKKEKSVGCGKVSITGKCEDGIGTCKFTLKRQCSPIKVTGIEPLKDAYHKLTGEDLPAERIEKATMGVCPPCLVAAPAKSHESRERG